MDRPLRMSRVIATARMADHSFSGGPSVARNIETDMRSLQDLKIGTRLRLAFGTLLLLITVAVVTGVLQARQLQSINGTYAHDIVPSARVMHQIVMTLDEARRLDWQVAYLDDDAERTIAEKRIAAAHLRLEALFKDYAPLVSDAEDARLVQVLDAASHAYLKAQDQLVAAGRLKVSDPAQRALAHTLVAGDARKAFNEAYRQAQLMWDANESLAAQMLADGATSYRNALLLLAGLGVGCLVLGIGAAAAITRSIVGPLSRALALANAASQGDLSHRADARSADEIGTLLTALGTMNTNLARMVGDIRAGAESIATASAEIAQGNHDLSSRTEAQASSLEQTAASMEEMAGNVKASADNAQQATRLATEAAQVAVEGGSAVGEVVATMGAISESSRRIADIIGVIDGIAFQTNILALNAAVEAARAGEQGRGFAVVAGEVRSLAHRAAEAAREIKSLIGDSVVKVEIGNQQVHKAGATIDAVVQQFGHVSALIGEITNASQQQALGVDQVNQAVGQLDHATQQNAALVEQTAAAAESMRQQAATLSDLVATFKF